MPQREQTNLMVFIRPKILTDSLQSAIETNSKYNLIRDAQIRQGKWFRGSAAAALRQAAGAAARARRCPPRPRRGLRLAPAGRNTRQPHLPCRLSDGKPAN